MKVILLIVAAIIIYFLLSNPKAVLSMIPFGIKKPPKEYRNYRNVISGIETESHIIEPLIKEKFKKIIINYFNENDNSVVVRTQNYETNKGAEPLPDVLMNKYYKLNTDGEIIDSLVLTDNDRSWEYEGYLINNEYYYTWMLNGDKTEYPLKIINGDLALSKEAYKEKFKALYKSAALVKILIHDKKYKQVFLIDNQWAALAGSNLLYYDEHKLDDEGKPVHYYGEKKLLPEKHIKRFSMPTRLIKEYEVWEQKSKYLNLVHFQKISYTKKKRESPFALHRGLHPAKWEGEGYFHLNFKNDTIPFKMYLEHLDRDPPDRYRLPTFVERRSMMYFTTEDLNYGLFSDNQGYKLFIVKRK